MAKAEQSQQKWQGKSTAELSGVTADQIWPFWADFCNLHKWHPNLNHCHQIEGIPGKPGLVRYCAAGKSSSLGNGDDSIKWCKERLLSIDSINRCLRYEILENNIGFKEYEATIKVSPADGGGGCKIEWSFVADPVEGMELEDLVGLVEFCLLAMVKKMEENVQSHVENLNNCN